MSSRADRQQAPLVRFDQRLLYHVRDRVMFSQLSPRQELFLEAVFDFKTKHEAQIIPGTVLKDIWTDVAQGTDYDPENHDVISKCLADGIVIAR